MEDVIPLVSSYKELYMEHRSILNDLKQYRKKFNARIKEIKQEMKNLEKDLLKYMREHDHPGLRFQELILIPSTKKRSKPDSNEVSKILLKYNVHSNNGLHQELLHLLGNEEEEPTQTIRVKLWNEKMQSIE